AWLLRVWWPCVVLKDAARSLQKSKVPVQVGPGETDFHFRATCRSGESRRIFQRRQKKRPCDRGSLTAVVFLDGHLFSRSCLPLPKSPRMDRENLRDSAALNPVSLGRS